MQPLRGVRVVEMASIGPGPFCGMLLADLGATVIRVERPDTEVPNRAADPNLRGRRVVRLDLKHPDGRRAVLDMVRDADAFFEGFRPGVAERLGIGPSDCLAVNPKLVYGRVTGWGRNGPLAHTAGHDINFLALSGALHLIGPAQGKPVPPLNLVGDFGGGGMLLAVGILSALFDALRTGRGSVVDAAMLDGIAAQLSMQLRFRAEGCFFDETGANLLAGAAPYYDTYRTSDGKYVAVGAIEPEFFEILLEKLGIDVERFRAAAFPNLSVETRTLHWPRLRAALAERFASRTRDEWAQVFSGSDACVTPVLSLEEAAHHPHNVERGVFVEVDGVRQNAPAPRFGDPAVAPPHPGVSSGDETEQVLRETGYSMSHIAELRRSGVIR